MQKWTDQFHTETVSLSYIESSAPQTSECYTLNRIGSVQACLW